MVMPGDGVSLDASNADQIGDLFDDLDKGSLEKFKGMRPSARNYFLALAEPILAESGDTAALEALYAVDYERIPPDPETFITHKDYCGHVGEFLFPSDRKSVV